MTHRVNSVVAKVERSVVQTITEHMYPNYTHPWVRTDRGKGTGSGFCVLINNKKYIITNVHCVQNPIRIQLHQADSAQNVPAKTVYAVEECDLAILETDEKFLKDIPALTIAEMPKKLETVYVIGYPLGGINVSVSTGVVNRIQIIPYLGVTRGIAIQVDAPINFGNSGGPVVNSKGQVVGVAFSGEDDAHTQNMGYMIPTLILNYVIEKFAAGIPHRGLGGNLQITTQSIVNPAMRTRYGLGEGDPGILITESRNEAVMVGDILTHVGKSTINGDGKIFLKDLVKIETGEVVPWNAGYSLIREGDQVELGLIRNGKKLHVKVTVGAARRAIPYMYTYELADGYVVVGGLVFVTLSWPLIDEKRQNRDGDTHHLVCIGVDTWMRDSEHQYVVLSDVLDSPLVEGYESRNQIVRSVNGKKFRNLSEFYGLVESVRATGTGYLEFEISETSTFNIVLDVTQLAAQQDQILVDNGISHGHHLPTERVSAKAPKEEKKDEKKTPRNKK